MITFKVLSEKSTTFNNVTSYRVLVEEVKTKKQFFVRNASPVVGIYGGGYCNEILPKGAKIKIGEEEITLNRDTGVDAYFTTVAQLETAKNFETAVL